ncbi:hypothetical protein EUTSA_v10013076mg [Eutrema salsugineum]|uniref:DUF3444 domain-containing protein n=2 Tax=Eutrema salsugineum TaxID=72664 RepID=V4LPU3_EUTSA|nr:hypothetical protein EUTSA_v10013076mg [Eutrema salsugineum]
MDITSNELLRRNAVSEALMKGTSCDGGTTFSSASAENILSPGLSFSVSVGEKRKRNEHVESCNSGNRGVVNNNNTGRGSDDKGDGERREESVEPKTSECSGLKFNDFEKLREEVNFAVGQTWALYDKVDGMPRLYAQIRKVSAPSFGLRITYLEPDPDDEKEIQWFEEDLPVSAGKFRLGRNQNTKDRSIFSHLIQCNVGTNTGHFVISPRKGETWALFKNWDMKWSSEPDSHRKYEYEFVEILSDYTDEAGVSVAYLHKAKGFASVFFRMGTDNADIFHILPHSLYRFSHKAPSFKLNGVEGKGLPKDAYELDQAALPEPIEEVIVPFYKEAKLTVPKPKPEALCFTTNGKVFQTGQFWAFSGYYDYDYMPRSYCKIQKITLTQAFKQKAEYKLHVSRLKPSPSQKNVILWKDKKMPAGCGTFFGTKTLSVFCPENVSHQIVPQISMDGNEYIILPKTGQVWAIYRCWAPHYDVEALEEQYLDFDIVEVLDDALDFKVLALKLALFPSEEKKRFFRAADSRTCDCGNCGDESEVTFTIPKSKRLTFSHQVPASRVTKEIDGELQEVFEVDSRALPSSLDY